MDRHKTATPKKLKILIVDDTRTVRHHTRSLLTDKEYDIDEAGDGIQALEKIKFNRPNLVLMDINMPHMNGIECCHCIKADNTLRSIKVIMVSTENEFAKIDQAFKAGCDDYVTKPVDQNELLRKIEELARFERCRQQLTT